LLSKLLLARIGLFALYDDDDDDDVDDETNNRD